MIVEYANVFATAKLFVSIIVIALVGVVLTELVMWIERRMSRRRQLSASASDLVRHRAGARQSGEG
jgi:ABC-type nitrate/sulfonate/bicarbonate transport system permease component